VQESSLGLVFHYADKAGLPLLDLKDLRAVLTHLTSDEGKAELKNIGGLSASTVGVILRTLINFADQGAEAFFGEPEFDIADLLRVTSDGRGVVSLLELPNLVDRPAVFSTFLMWLLADLFHELPEVGDVDKPKLVFFFDEAHLLFDDASKAFLGAIAQTVRLIRSKGVGIFFVTQLSPRPRRMCPTRYLRSWDPAYSTSYAPTRQTMPRLSSRLSPPFPNPTTTWLRPCSSSASARQSSR
jgi:DNA helicase HerA-like ATPase